MLTEPPVTEENGEACRLPYGLVHAYRLLGHEAALTLAGKNLRYLRRHYRDGEPRLRSVTRFVSSEHVDW